MYKPSYRGGAISGSSVSKTTLPGAAPRMLSRITSQKRDWGTDDDGEVTLIAPPVELELKTKAEMGSSQPVDWEASPDRIRRKAYTAGSSSSSNPSARTPTSASSSASASGPNGAPAGVDPEIWASMSGADRRRYAISGKLPTSNSTSSASTSSRSLASSSTAYSLSSAQTPYVTGNGRPPLQELPSLPESDLLAQMDRKRAMPWEADSKPSKRPNRNASAQSNDSAKSTGPSLSIKQRISLSNEQKEVLRMVVDQGKSLFFTGSAGTGKSVLLREIIKSLRKKYMSSPDAVAVTASTGIAACNIGGVTLHSFGGAGLALEDVKLLVGKIRKNKKAAARWARTKVLIIDEVSMVDGDLFDKYCKIGQAIRKNTKPFGGIQIIVTGDFFQLPPVTKNGATPKFCFAAATWAETISEQVNLTKVFRQKDQRFVDMLNEMRFGQLSTQSELAFKALARPIHYNDDIEPTELFPMRGDVDRSNNARLNALTTDGWSYTSSDGGVVTDPVQREKLLSNFMAPQHIALKVDAQVMLIKNVDETLVNGSMGKVVGFCHKALYDQSPSGRWLRDDDVMKDLDDEGREREERKRQLVLSKMAVGTKPLPVVTFKVPGGGLRDMLVEQDTFKSELPNGEVQASRMQLPLILAWAMSIHKSQGQTLDRVKVDLSKVFEKGQAYVALSRATSMEGLQVLGFSKAKVNAHAAVARWSATLKNLNT